MTPILNVLLAEDPTRAPLRPFLREIPTVAIVAEATDGRVALPLIAAHQPDVAIVDTALPGLNGFDVAERASRDHPRTRVLVVSTEPELAHVAQAVRVGASDICSRRRPTVPRWTWRSAPSPRVTSS